MRINRIDVNTSVDAANTSPMFVAACKRQCCFAKRRLVEHGDAHGNTGEVVALPQGVTVPLIRIGEVDVNVTFQPMVCFALQLQPNCCECQQPIPSTLVFFNQPIHKKPCF